MRFVKSLLSASYILFTEPFHGGNTGSNPVRGRQACYSAQTSFNKRSTACLYGPSWNNGDRTLVAFCNFLRFLPHLDPMMRGSLDHPPADPSTQDAPRPARRCLSGCQSLPTPPRSSHAVTHSSFSPQIICDDSPADRSQVSEVVSPMRPK